MNKTVWSIRIYLGEPPMKQTLEQVVHNISVCLDFELYSLQWRSLMEEPTFVILLKVGCTSLNTYCMWTKSLTWQKESKTIDKGGRSLDKCLHLFIIGSTCCLYYTLLFSQNTDSSYIILLSWCSHGYIIRKLCWGLRNLRKMLPLFLMKVT